MFTGLIEKTGKLTARRNKGSDMAVVTLSVSDMWQDVVLGESIAVNGVCLTVTQIGKESFNADVSLPTLEATTLGRLAIGAPVNLERALRVGDRLGGHMVQGHVDGVGTIQKITVETNNVFLTVAAPYEILSKLILKGSIAIDGISLTIQALEERSFTAVIIPHTFKHTNLSFAKTYDCVNLEGDIISKYVERHLLRKEPLSEAYLREQGF